MTAAPDAPLSAALAVPSLLTRESRSIACEARYATPARRPSHAFQIADATTRGMEGRATTRDEAGACVFSYITRMSWWSRFRRPQPRVTSPVRRCGLVVPSLGSGGLEEVVATLATELPKLGYETMVLCTHAGGAVEARLRHQGVSVTVADGSAAQWRAWAKAARPDVLSTHFVSHAAMEVLARFAPAVETVHNTYVWLSAKEWELERDKCAAAAAVVAVSDLVASYHRRALSGRDARVIPNGVRDDRLVEIEQAMARERLGCGADDVVLVQTGRFCIQKNQRGLVEALTPMLEDDRRLRLLLVGGHDDRAYVKSVHDCAPKLAASARIQLLPATADVAAILSAADAFIANSFFEGWSLAATEALWLGRPVIVSDTGGSREQTGANGERGVVVPNPGGAADTLRWEDVLRPSEEASERNRRALQSAVRAFVEDRRGWEGRREAIRHEARLRWSATQMATSYADVFRDVDRV